MPGFVDVSGMTYEQVRRMGHADDYDAPTRNPYAYRKPAFGASKVTMSFNADDVWAVACAAFRINGSYVKAIAPGTTQKTNRQIAEELLKDQSLVTSDDRAKGQLARQYYKGLTFKVIEGKTLNDFNKNAMEIASLETITTTYQLAIIVSLPASYEKSSKRDDVDRRINFARGGYVGVVGEKVSLNIEVLKQLWSEKYNTWYLTGITTEDQVVFFACRENFDIGTHLTITGSVKGQRETSTQLNRVKVI
jgi:hypothetical protein